MGSYEIVLLEGDGAHAAALAGTLRDAAHTAIPASTLEELRRQLASRCVPVATINLEYMPLDELERLRQDYPSTVLLCYHRVADEEMWMAAMQAGATDVCRTGEWQSIVRTLQRLTQPLRRRVAA